MRVVGIDHHFDSSEYSGELGEQNVSKRREIYICSDEYENSKILSHT